MAVRTPATPGIPAIADGPGVRQAPRTPRRTDTRLVLGGCREHGLDHRPPTRAEPQVVVAGPRCPVEDGWWQGLQEVHPHATGPHQPVDHARQFLVADLPEPGEEQVRLMELGNSVAFPLIPGCDWVIRDRSRIGLQHGDLAPSWASMIATEGRWRFPRRQ